MNLKDKNIKDATYSARNSLVRVNNQCPMSIFWNRSSVLELCLRCCHCFNNVSHFEYVCKVINTFAFVFLQLSVEHFSKTMYFNFQGEILLLQDFDRQQ